MSDSDNDDRGLEGWLVVQDDGGSLLLQSPTGEWRRVDTDKQEMERLERVNRLILAESVRAALLNLERAAREALRDGSR